MNYQFQKQSLPFENYEIGDHYDELYQKDGNPRKGAQLLANKLRKLPEGELVRRQKAAELALLNMGITFTVYGDESGTERIFPFDIIPRIIEPADWQLIERGLVQRIQALNLFIDDIYHDQKILKDKVIPKELIESCKGYQPLCRGLNPPKDIWCHIVGTDIVRDNSSNWFVLEDNLCCPSGVSYVLENRAVMKHTFPEVFKASSVRPVDDYPIWLLECLQYLAPPGVEDPKIVILSPGVYNSAYFEHSFLANKMGIELVEGRDLVVVDGGVHMRTTKGFRKVDVIYRRINDDFLDPKVFRPDSLLGIPGIMEVYKKGQVALANAPGTGVSDDKIIYTFVPQIIKYYLGEDPLLSNVETFVCYFDKERKYVVDNLDKLVVKPANGSGGNGILVGPESSRKDRRKFARLIEENPRNYIAQPTLSLSRVPTIVDEGLEGRHVDFRPYVLYGEKISVIPGGLTRVALKKGSLIVNSSQGGGSKDTWVLSKITEK